MAHAFVLAKLNPELTATMGRMSHQVMEAADCFVAHPFLALVIALDESHPAYRWDYRSVFYPIYPVKPTGDFSEYYVMIQFAASTAQARLVYPDSENSSSPQRQLSDVVYVQTVPPLFQTSTLPVHALSHHLDSVSLERFMTLATDHIRAALQASFQQRRSGGEETVQKSWGSWSHADPLSIESLRAPPNYVHFDYLDPEGIDVFSLESPGMMEDLKIFRTLVVDYSWKRVRHVISWCIDSRRGSPIVPTLPDSINSITQNQELDSETIEHITRLYRMRIPVDRQVRPADTDEDWEPPNIIDPVGHLGFNRYPPVSASDIQVVLFDSIGTIFDRETSVLRALRSLGLQEIDGRSEDILGVYFESESIVLHDNPQWTLDQVVKRALQDTIVHFSGASTRFNPGLLELARRDLFHLDLYPDAVKTIDTLSAQGIFVVGFSIPGSRSFDLSNIPSRFIFDTFPLSISALSVTSPDLFTDLFERLRLLCDTLERQEQVLVVTSGRFRVLEPARLAGYPTALVQHNFESKVDMGPRACKPTLIVPDLNGLLESLVTFVPTSSANPIFTAYAPSFTRPMNSLVKEASEKFGMESMPAAIKYDSIGYTDKEHVCETNPYPCSFPYEAQIYKLLRGATGFPSLRWSVVKDGAHILILDKLGPDLDAIRRLCRGRLSLKTVLMLGSQMLERVAVIHSRGLILRDLKPDNFAMGLGERSSIVHMFDFGLARPYVNLITGEHIPFVEGLARVGTARYSSYNMLMGRETSRRDDIEALGYILMYLLRGHLPWQGIYAPSIEAKYIRITEMRVGKAMQDFIDESPGRDVWHRFFRHCRELGFTDKPDYDFLEDMMLKQLGGVGGFDWRYDWLDGGALEYGTLVPGEYKLDARLFGGGLKDLIPRGVSLSFGFKNR